MKRSTGKETLPMAAKRMGAVFFYLLLLCFFLKIEVFLLFDPRYVGMFFAGCIILFLPHFEKGTGWKEIRSVFWKNAITAGYLEAFMLLFVSMNQAEQMQNTPWRELALDMRPLFYGLVCYTVLKEPKKGRKETASEETVTGRELTSLKETETGGNLSDGKETEADESQKFTKKTEKANDFSKLTRQEKLVAELAGRGLTNREIGEELCISEATVKKHLSNIFEKLQISSRKELN